MGDLYMMKYIVIIFCILLGVLLHFLYEFSKYNKTVAIFSATNESIWEHLKLSFFPIVMIGIIEYVILQGNVNNFWTSKLVASVVAILFTIISFYTYSGIIGKDYFVIDILIFIISIILAENISYRIMKFPNYNFEVYSIIILIATAIIFGIFTFYPPKIPLFQDPISKKYGIEKN